MLAAAVASASARQPAPPVPVLVELFTSEGCSSCPPADQLLIELSRNQPVAGAVVIGLSEHVDYWDHQGWKDPFSQARFTDRQSVYAPRLGVPDIYTPQMVVDGTRELIGQDRVSALSAIASSARSPKRVLRLTWTADATPALAIQIAPGPSGAADHVWLAVTEDGLASSVTRGENQGRRLTHAAVVRRLDEIGRADARGAFDKTVRVPLDAAWKPASLRVVVFAQSARSFGITAAGAIIPPRP